MAIIPAPLIFTCYSQMLLRRIHRPFCFWSQRQIGKTGILYWEIMGKFITLRVHFPLIGQLTTTLKQLVFHWILE